MKLWPWVNAQKPEKTKAINRPSGHRHTSCFEHGTVKHKNNVALTRVLPFAFLRSLQKLLFKTTVKNRLWSSACGSASCDLSVRIKPSLSLFSSILFAPMRKQKQKHGKEKQWFLNGDSMTSCYEIKKNTITKGSKTVTKKPRNPNQVMSTTTVNDSATLKQRFSSWVTLHLKYFERKYCSYCYLFEEEKKSI